MDNMRDKGTLAPSVGVSKLQLKLNPLKFETDLIESIKIVLGYKDLEELDVNNSIPYKVY